MEIDMSTAWHGRFMVMAWAVLFPLGILIARYFKVMPGQKWPDELDNRIWWYSHLTFQYVGGLCLLVGVWLALTAVEDPARQWLVHRVLGRLTLALVLVQFFSGWLRGTMGGPTDPGAGANLFGDHYNMTRRRRLFERFHKINGYAMLLLSVVTILTGLFVAIAPWWMYAVLIAWWVLICVAFAQLQLHGRCVDSYQAIWGVPCDQLTGTQESSDARAEAKRPK